MPCNAPGRKGLKLAQQVLLGKRRGGSAAAAAAAGCRALCRGAAEMGLGLARRLCRRQLMQEDSLGQAATFTHQQWSSLRRNRHTLTAVSLSEGRGCITFDMSEQLVHPVWRRPPGVAAACHWTGMT